MTTEALVSPKGYQDDSRNVGYTAYPQVMSVDRSGTVYQVAIFTNDAGRVILARRDLTNDGPWETWEPAALLSARTGSNDDHHNASCIYVDSTGIIHVAYDQHNDSLRYHRSDQPVESFDGGFSAALDMVNSANEDVVTYPRFFTDPAGKLYFLFRDGGAGNGDWYFYEYDTGTESWSAPAGSGTDGLLIDGRTNSQNPYGANPPAFDSDFGSGGFMHLFWTWRETSDPATTHDVMYARWDGTSWEQSDGTAQTVPITSGNDEVIFSIAQGVMGGLRNRTLVNASDQPLHSVFHDDAGGDGRSYLVWWDGAAWQKQQIENLSASDLADADPASPIAIDASTDEAYLFRRVGDEYRFWISDPGDYTTWTAMGAFYDPVDGIIGASDALSRTPHYDFRRWDDDGVWEGFFQRGVTTTS